MQSSRDAKDSLLPERRAPQHERSAERAPRPLPLFLELVREVSMRDPELARAALSGLRAYAQAPRLQPRASAPAIARVGGATLRDHAGKGMPVVLVPSLINPPNILDLDPEVSLTDAIARMGHKPLLVDWGPARDRASLSVAGHVEELLLPLLEALGEPAILIGYCLGGTMAIAAANVAPVAKLATIAAPWHFAAYPDASRDALIAMWRHAEPSASALGALPMEVLQAAFWSLDPERTVGKFAKFGRLDPQSPSARRFVELEQWANEGEPLPLAAANELFERMFGHDLPGRGEWLVGGNQVTSRIDVPALHLLSEHDRIAPAATAAEGERVAIASGHVGMIVGSVRARLHHALEQFLLPCR